MKKWNSLSQEEADRRKDLQCVLEEDLMGIGVDRYWNEVNRSPDECEPEQQLLDASIIHLQPIFQDWIDEVCSRPKTPAWCIPLLSIGSFKAADIVIRNIIKLTLGGTAPDGLVSGWGKDPRAQNISYEIGDDVVNIVSYQRSKENFKEDWKKQSKFTKNWSPKRCHAFTKKVSSVPDLSRKHKQDFGHAMLRIALLSDIIILEKVRKKNRGRIREIAYVRFNDDILQELHNKHHLLELSSLIYRPMIAPPLDHAEDEPGGSYLRWIRKPTVKRYVNTNRKIGSSIIKNHCSPLVLAGLNALQKTEWCINTQVLDVMDNLFHNNTCLGNLPAHEFCGFEMRDFPEDGNKVDKAKWMLEREEKWGNWYKDEQKRSRMLVRLHLAKNMIRYEWFYHSYSLDFRGRAYTGCELLSPQGSDFDKGLLLFANTVTQTTKGLYHIKVHTANHFDMDHLTYDERVQWVDDNWDMLMRIADDPYANREWISDKAKKNPSFQRLACCFELARKDGLTQLPVQRDGKCNGSQHWSVIMGDVTIATLTNVIPSDRPQDLYNYIANKTTRILVKNEDKIDWYSEFTDHWNDGLDRGVVKRPTMCDAYGLTFYGTQKYIKLEGHLDWVAKEVRGGAVTELARAIREGLNDALTKPNAGKDWLKSAAQQASDKDMHLVWTTPSGFIVEHVYQPIRQRRSYTELYNKQKFELVFAIYDDGVNKDGQVLGISPNFIHSLDAAHMFITIFLLTQVGILDLSMIHDSYGCHAPFVDILDKLLRQGFVETHKENVLEQFKEDIQEYCGVTISIPPNTSEETGRLDPRHVLESEYFFT